MPASPRTKRSTVWRWRLAARDAEARPRAAERKERGPLACGQLFHEASEHDDAEHQRLGFDPLLEPVSAAAAVGPEGYRADADRHGDVGVGATRRARQR